MELADLAAGLDDLVTAHRILAFEGQGDRTSGHLSWRDPQGRGLWMKRARIGMDEVTGHDDLLLVDFDGNVVAGSGERHIEWPIHAEILRSRPDVVAVGHTHAFYSQIFASTDEPLRPIAKEGVWFDDPPKFHETCSLIRTPELGRRLAATLGSSDAVFLLSHGLAFVGSTIRECALVGIYLEAAVRAQITIAMTGFSTRWPDAEDVRAKRAQTRTPRNIDNYWQYLERKLTPTSAHTG